MKLWMTIVVDKIQPIRCRKKWQIESSYINKCNPSISHCSWDHAPKQLYISLEHRIRSMHKNFIAYYLNDCASYIYYQIRSKILTLALWNWEQKSVWFANCIYLIWKRSICVQWDREHIIRKNNNKDTKIRKSFQIMLNVKLFKSI